MPPAGSKNAPEALAREKIDALLEAAGWAVQDRDEMNLSVPAVAVREFKLARGHGFADYLLFVDRQAVGVVEAKPAGTLLRNVERQTDRYVQGLPDELDAPHRPLPCAYISTGAETAFIDHFDPNPRTREIFSFHRPETIRESPACTDYPPTPYSRKPLPPEQYTTVPAPRRNQCACSPGTLTAIASVPPLASWRHQSNASPT